MAELPARMRVRDAALMRALAHPLRAELLTYLMAVGPRTASECATAVGSTASNCSWHLRQLAGFGLVERAEGGNSRDKPWRATQVGLEFEEFSPDPATHAAQLAVLGANAAGDQVLTQRFVDSVDVLEPEWQRTSGLNTYSLRVNAAELAELTMAIDSLLRPYVTTIRPDAPPDARPVHASWRAFPRIEADGTPSS
ncbi:winged helix-turn-helix domain-containing protein [Kibdelosporangium phytohabitans]|uniref:ArsR family transcriptional regulator n=1 Tax=Kibdelosporangium phytohabitans TaxID=860235 RepID=A0A0N9I6M0_9PSEU|nr:winged helix-turn-helix domain-containing protein [Kibdelosporangium phytohabitans]ALG11337.1 ArsR family transcriptional regulator [Kibdelosporangium phytohabitans]MBE1462648.1 DNA-binding transcriptional ArsR family regulator [Kibdelosporangium phytohabitans]